MTTTLTLSPDQQQAFDQIQSWLANKPEQLTLGGFAGTGKTTIIKELLEAVQQKYRPIVMALTGKACSVLLKKGVSPVQTIHSTIYDTYISKGKPVFTLRSSIPFNFFIIDEASMVNNEIYKDLKSFRFPMLFVGDHGQLEPIGDNPMLMKSPQVKLEKIHRQAEGNPIITYAHKLRQKHWPKITDTIVQMTPKKQITKETLTGVDQIICGKNKTRVQINKECRNLLGYPKDTPVVGDKVICLKNNRKFGIYNGLQGVILEITQVNSNGIDSTFMRIALDGGGEFYGEIHPDQFNLEKGFPEDADWKSDETYWDYAYAVTCHKSQGSEWNKVLVIEEYLPVWDMAKWRYTAATRASEELIYAI